MCLVAGLGDLVPSLLSMRWLAFRMTCWVLCFLWETVLVQTVLVETLLVGSLLLDSLGLWKLETWRGIRMREECKSWRIL